jgi:hypothetical protein
MGDSDQKTFSTLHALRDAGFFRALTAIEARLLLVYVSRADSATGEAHPGVQSLAIDVGVKNLGRVRAALRRLEAAGILAVVKVGGGRERSTVRRIACPKTGTESGPVLSPTNRDLFEPPSMPATIENRDHHRPKTGTNRELNRDHPERKQGPKASPEPRRTTTSRGTRAAQTWQMSSLPVELRAEKFFAAWLAWIAYRHERKKSLTPSTIERQLAKCQKHGIEAGIAAIDESIEKGWVGFFPENHTRGAYGQKKQSGQYKSDGLQLVAANAKATA